MDNEELHHDAELLLSLNNNFLVENEIYGWPWQPFHQPCDEEIADRRRQLAFKQLADETITDSNTRKAAAEELAKLGGYKINNGCAELSSAKFLFHDHRERVEKFESIDDFDDAFQRYVVRWHNDQPDWSYLQDELLRHKLVRLTELNKLTLIDVRNALPHLDAERFARDHHSSEPTAERLIAKPQNYWIEDGQEWIVGYEGTETRLGKLGGAYYYWRILRAGEKTVEARNLYHSYNEEPTTLTELDSGMKNPIMDPRYIEAVTIRIARLQDNLESAEVSGEAEKAAELKDEIEKLQKQLKAQTNIRSESRQATKTRGEKAFDTIRKRLSTVLKTLQDKKCHSLVAHLNASVRPVQGWGWEYRPIEKTLWTFDRK